MGGASGGRRRWFRASRCFLCAGPAAVTNLTLASANSSSLSFSWRPSDGHVDAYDVSLHSVPEGGRSQQVAAASPVCQNVTPPHDTRVGLQGAGELLDLRKLPAASDGCVFTGLTAGSLYRLQVVSWSRDMSSDSATLARTGQSARHVNPRGFLWSHDPR